MELFLGLMSCFGEAVFGGSLFVDNKQFWGIKGCGGSLVLGDQELFWEITFGGS